MSKYYVNKFLFTVDRDPELLADYVSNPAHFVARWELEIGRRLLNSPGEVTTVLEFTSDERAALINLDYVALFEMGAHFFLNLTLFIAVHDEEWTRRNGPLSFQREFAARLESWAGQTYPSVAT